MAPPHPEAMADLAAVLGTDPPAGLADVDPAVVRRRAAAISTESTRQEQAIEQSVDDALRLVPRPFRGIVRRLIVP